MTDYPAFLQGSSIDRRKFALGLVFASAALTGAWRQPSERLDYLGGAKLDDVIPKTIGEWRFLSNSGLVVPPDDQLAGLLYSQLLTRVYSDNESSPVMLLIAQSASQTGMLQVHRPEFCYPAGGYRLSPTVQQSMMLNGRTLVTNSLTASANGLEEQILYWTRIGDHMPVTWRDQRLAVAGDNLRGMVPDAVMVRASTIDNNREAAGLRLERFIRNLMEEVPDKVRRALVSFA